MNRTFALLMLLGLAACRAPLDPVVIRFGGVDVRRSVFLKELEPLAKSGTDISDPLIRTSAFTRFVEEKVVAIAAQPHGFKTDEDARVESERWLATTLGPAPVSEAEGVQTSREISASVE